MQRYSKSQVKRAGEIIIARNPYPYSDEVVEAFRLAHQWRDMHVVPMRAARRELKILAHKAKVSGQAAGRLKRFQSIRRKMRARPLSLYQMQDIAGVRIILDKIDDVDADAAELWEIDENFARAELTDAQRADHHVRREAILVRKGEVSTHGGPRNQVAESATCSYAQKAAADLGVSERTIRQDLSRGKKIDAAVLAEVAGTPLDKGVVLDELARVPAEVQEASKPSD